MVCLSTSQVSVSRELRFLKELIIINTSFNGIMLFQCIYTS